MRSRSRPEDAAADARQNVVKRRRKWLRRLERCQCLRPVRARCYLGTWLCAKCKKLRPRRRVRFTIRR